MALEDTAGFKDLWAFLDARRAQVDEQTRRVAEGIPGFAEAMRRMSREEQVAQQKEGLELQRRALVDGDWVPFLGNLKVQAATFAHGGVPFSDWLRLVTAFRRALQPDLSALAARDSAAASRLTDALNSFVEITLGVLGDAYTEAKERRITEQQQAIRELSTPVLQLRDGLLLLPIVGVVDTHRARHLTASMLRAIRDRRARVVVMDITGVPIVDSKVANHLVQACEAARLMGAGVILTGISAEIAQALVAIGAELHGVRTVNDLQGGIEEGEAQLGYRVVRGSPASGSHGEAPEVA